LPRASWPCHTGAFLVQDKDHCATNPDFDGSRRVQFTRERIRADSGTQSGRCSSRTGRARP
jgi:hypothetical protein